MTRALAPAIVTAAIVAVLVAALLATGHPPICPCGSVKLWHGANAGPGSSQHLTDWYTPSHVIHGLFFYWLLWLTVPRLSFGWRLAIATAIEVAWEIVENSPWVIDRYRQVTISYDYFGDRVINSVMDVLAMMLGFWLAAWLPVWLSLALVVGAELVTGLMIRDGLILNVIMLIWPIEAIRVWQAGG